jgi:two-component system nitrate/nitrite response regulator NarL
MITVHTGVRVLVVGPHDLVTTSMIAALQTHGFSVQEWSGEAALPTAPRSCGLAIINLPVRAGVVTAAVRSGWQVVVVFGHGDTWEAAAAVADGAAATIPRSAPVDELLEAVARLAAGGSGMTPEERQAHLQLHRLTQMRLDASRRQLDALTDREFEVLQRLERGQRAADIAQDAVVAMSTVRTHIRSILEKLEVHSQRQAVEIYREARRHVG